MIDWLLSPMNGSSSIHVLSAPIAWHGRLMVLAWGFIIPLGIVSARYWKILPKQNWPVALDSKHWWRLHKYGQIIAAVFIAFAVYLIVFNGSSSRAWHWHAGLGWVVVVVTAMQVISGLTRGSKGGPTDTHMRGDHFDLTPRRRFFERAHKSMGWLALLISVATILTGLIHADAPRWMLVVLVTWWVALIALSWRWQKQGRCIDTYQAIWGNDPRLPGMKHTPIGWGIRRINQGDKP